MTRFLTAILVWLALSFGASAAISVHSTSTGVSHASPGGTSQPIVLPSSTQAGDQLACALDLVAASGSPTTPTWPGGWTVINEVDSLDNSIDTSIGYKVATGSEGGTTITPTASESTSLGSYFCWDINGVDTATAPATAWAPGNAGSLSLPFPSLSPSWGSATTSLLMVNFSAYSVGAAITVSSWPSGYTSNQSSQTPLSTFNVAGMADRIAAVSTESPSTVSVSRNMSSYLTGTFAFKAAKLGGTINIPMLGM